MERPPLEQLNQELETARQRLEKMRERAQQALENDIALKKKRAGFFGRMFGRYTDGPDSEELEVANEAYAHVVREVNELEGKVRSAESLCEELDTLTTGDAEIAGRTLSEDAQKIYDGLLRHEEQTPHTVLHARGFTKTGYAMIAAGLLFGMFQMKNKESSSTALAPSGRDSTHTEQTPADSSSRQDTSSRPGSTRIVPTPADTSVFGSQRQASQDTVQAPVPGGGMYFDKNGKLTIAPLDLGGANTPGVRIESVRTPEQQPQSQYEKVVIIQKGGSLWEAGKGLVGDESQFLRAWRNSHVTIGDSTMHISQANDIHPGGSLSYNVVLQQFKYTPSALDAQEYTAPSLSSMRTLNRPTPERPSVRVSESVFEGTQTPISSPRQVSQTPIDTTGNDSPVSHVIPNLEPMPIAPISEERPTVTPDNVVIRPDTVTENRNSTYFNAPPGQVSENPPSAIPSWQPLDQLGNETTLQPDSTITSQESSPVSSDTTTSTPHIDFSEHNALSESITVGEDGRIHRTQESSVMSREDSLSALRALGSDGKEAVITNFTGLPQAGREYGEYLPLDPMLDEGFALLQGGVTEVLGLEFVAPDQNYPNGAYKAPENDRSSNIFVLPTGDIIRRFAVNGEIRAEFIPNRSENREIVRVPLSDRTAKAFTDESLRKSFGFNSVKDLADALALQARMLRSN